MSLGLIWAQADGRVIGRDGGMPWHLPEDLARFRALTFGHPVVMGRRSWESIPAGFRPLRGRRNIVVTRDPQWAAPGAETASSVEEALALAGPDSWVIGGAQLYEATLERADRLEVTEIDLTVDGDTFAPELGPEWMREAATAWADSATGLRYRFVSYRRGPLP